MPTTPQAIKRATDQETIAPLVELCKAGRLFDVQAWIAAGKPVNSPPPPDKGQRPRTPLEYAIDRGFHSLVQVLLEAGAVQEPEGYDAPIYQALRARRFDIVQLLVEHGFDPKAVDMHAVFCSWDPQIMDYFIERGAELQQGHPFASALCDRIRTALGRYKRCRERMPELQEQADIALRHHCKEGNLKWVSLMLWAGADPYNPGTENPGEELDEDDGGLSALGFAALYGHYEVFELKPIRSRPVGPAAAEMLLFLTRGKGLDILKRLLEKGLDPNDQESGGCSTIRSCLDGMSWARHYSPYAWERDAPKRSLDTSESRDKLKAIHLLAKHGAKWMPVDKREVDSARRSLLRLKPDYTIEFVWIMGKYQACTVECVNDLLRTPAMKSHTAAYRARLQEILALWS
ncbi:MAG: ankyrin repeat domain-containing protein [Phycisphaeraceae bacterium]